MKNKDIIEVLSCPQTTGDLWDELQRDINPLKKFLCLREGVEYTIRLLGPFMQANRLYNPQPYLVTEHDIDVKRIAARDDKYFDEVTTVVQNLIVQSNARSSMKYNELAKFLMNAYRNFDFKKCVVSNAYVKSGDNANEPKVKLVALSVAVCKEIMQKVPEANTRISGLQARDITLKRKGSGLISRHEIDIKKETMLGYDEIKKIFSQGLEDIPTLLAAANKRNGAFYYQFQSNQYKMPQDLINVLFQDVKYVEESQHLNRANLKINDVPRNAFEKNNEIKNLISHIDIE